MFTGLVQDIGIVRGLDTSRGDLRVAIEARMNLFMIPLGASICCSGCCLTVVDKRNNTFMADVSDETLNRTNLGAWSVMTRINLEPSLRMGDELGGHFVFGHVDGVADILDIRREGDSHRIDLSIPDGLEHLFAEKGSVAVDGISLTVNKVSDKMFGVNIVPHTWQKTTLSDRCVGDRVNIEVDMLARYVARIMEVKNG